jgi:L-2,4-diaminobutyric acid acetyltransferase
MRASKKEQMIMTKSNPRAAEGAGAAPASSPIRLRAPAAQDGKRVWDLIAACPPLDRNSLYCNLLQCSDFAETCVLAEKDGEAVGWVSGYRPPADHDALFVWQVAVHESARGEGLAKKMIEEILSRPAARGVTKIKTTITPGNNASWSVFRSIAAGLAAPLASEAWFERETHFAGAHETEHLVTIGPFGAFSGARTN